MQLFINNWSSYLSSPLSSSASLMQIPVEAASMLAAAGDGDYYLLTLVGLDPLGVETAHEIVRVTAVAGGSVSVDRGQEGTGAAEWPLATRIEARFTAGAAAAPAALLSAHAAADDPHPQYVTSEELSEAVAGATASPVVVFDGAVLEVTGVHDRSWIAVDSSGDSEVVVSPQSSGGWGAGAIIEVERAGSGEVLFAAGQGVAIRLPASKGPRIAERYGVARLRRVASDLWNLHGDLGEYIPPPAIMMALGLESAPYLVLYNLTDGAKLNAPDVGVGVSALALSPDGSRLAVGCAYAPYLVVFNTADWSSVAITDARAHEVSELAWSPDGSRLAVGSPSYPRLTCYSASTWQLVPGVDDEVVLGNPVRGLAWSPDGSRLAVALEYTSDSANKYLVLFNTADWTKIVGPLDAVLADATDVAWSPDGSRLAIASMADTGVRVLDTSDWSVSDAPVVSYARALAWSPDGSRLAVALANSPRLRVYDTGSWASVFSPAGSAVPAQQATDVHWSADGTRLAVSNMQGYNYDIPFTVYDTTLWEEFASLPSPFAAPTYSGGQAVVLASPLVAWGL